MKLRGRERAAKGAAAEYLRSAGLRSCRLGGAILRNAVIYEAYITSRRPCVKKRGERAAPRTEEVRHAYALARFATRNQYLTAASAALLHVPNCCSDGCPIILT